MLRVRIERVEVKYSGKFTDYDGADIINMAIGRLNRSGVAANIEYVEVENYDGYISPTCKDEDILKVRVHDKYPCNHIAEIEWYYVEETEDEPEDDYYYEDSRQFYEDDCSPKTYAGWAQQDTIDMYRRER